MIKYILKMWTNNIDFFPDAVRLRQQGVIDGVELYNNVSTPLDWPALETLKPATVLTIHNPHSHGWHDHWITPEQVNHWAVTKTLADFFAAARIIVHPARTHTREQFWSQYSALQDERILVENMAGLDINRDVMAHGQTLEDLEDIAQTIPICFDLEKAVKAAAYQRIPYQTFIADGIARLRPTYFHLSGGVASDAMDQHLNLWEGSIDMHWIKDQLTRYASDHDIFVAFETPKADGLHNDEKNIAFFKNL